MVFDKILDFLFPPKCIICGKLLDKNADTFICEKCNAEYKFKIICCSKCSGVMTETERPVCYTCRAAKRYFDGAVSASRYTENLRKAIHRYKFHPEPYMAKTLAGFIEYAFIKSGAKADSFDFILTVPPDKKRYRNRGFDHTALLGKAASEKLNVPFLDNAAVKIKSNLPQHRLNARQRAANVRGAYKVVKPDEIKCKNILLIDDVFTTGSTAGEVSKMLKKAGAKYVLVATIAKTVPKI
ncbi:MAG: ComF family protein [Clostridia bacterium]|nr:ComF family protein [Clostridia bacterium]MBR2973939.1 ComF family protein [Clostridia bacterium]